MTRDEMLQAVREARRVRRIEKVKAVLRGALWLVVAFLALAFVVGAVVVFSGCSGAQQRAEASGIAHVANAGAPLLAAAYEADPRPTEEADRAWKPAQDAWRAFRAAQDAYATALEQGGNPDFEKVRRAYCALLAALPPAAAPDLRLPGVCP